MSCVLGTYLYGVFDCVFLSCNIRVFMWTICDMIRTHSQMHHINKYQQYRSVIWVVWLNGWLFIDKLSSRGFESRCSHLPSVCLSVFLFVSFSIFFSQGLLSEIFWAFCVKLGWHEVILKLIYIIFGKSFLKKVFMPKETQNAIFQKLWKVKPWNFSDFVYEGAAM